MPLVPSIRLVPPVRSLGATNFRVLIFAQIGCISALHVITPLSPFAVQTDYKGYGFSTYIFLWSEQVRMHQ